MNGSDINTFHVDLDRLRNWAVENEMKINPGKIKIVRFMTARVKDPLNYFGRDQRITEASNCRYSGIILRSDMSWVDRDNKQHKKPGRHIFVLCAVLKREIVIRKI